MATYKEWFLGRREQHASDAATASRALSQAQQNLTEVQNQVAQHQQNLKLAEENLAAVNSRLTAANNALLIMEEPTLGEQQLNMLFEYQQQAE